MSAGADGDELVRAVAVAVGGARARHLLASIAPGVEPIDLDHPADMLGVALHVPVAMVAVDWSEQGGTAPQPMIGAVRELWPTCDLVVLHDAADVAGMWASFRAGAVPRCDPSHPVHTPGAGDPGAATAMDAIHLELTNRHGEACEALAALRRRDEVADGIDVLCRTGAAALRRLTGRARFAVPVGVLVDHVGDHVGTLDGEAFSAWWTMVERIAFRAAGLELDLLELELHDRQAPLLFGAFHAATAIVRLTARRQWRPAIELLQEPSH